MVNIHAREITDNLASLVKQIDALVSDPSQPGKAGNKHAFVVFLTEDPDSLAPKLQALAEKLELKHTPLTTFDGIAGPKGYKIAEEADVTVMMWVNQQATVNHAFRKGELDEAAVKKIVADAKQHLE